MESGHKFAGIPYTNTPEPDIISIEYDAIFSRVQKYNQELANLRAELETFTLDYTRRIREKERLVAALDAALVKLGEEVSARQRLDEKIPF